MSELAIELRGLQHRYDADLVLRGVGLTIEHGKIFGLKRAGFSGGRDVPRVRRSLVSRICML